MIIDMNDIRDSLLKEQMSQDDIAEAEDSVFELAESMGINFLSFPNPIPAKVKRFTIAIACMIVARNNTGLSPANADTEDPYKTKFNIYKQEVDKLFYEITPRTFLNDIADAPYWSIPIGRS